MKTILRISCLSLLFLSLACSKDDDPVTVVPKSSAKAITSFVFNAADNAALEQSVSTIVTEASKTANANVPNGTDVSALTPTITVSDKASVSPSGAQDFSNPVSYVVTAEDGTAVNYTVTITVLAQENSAPLSFELIDLPDNAVGVDVLPTLSWEAAIDPDGDSVNYDLYLDTGENATQLYAENISETSYELTERLRLLKNYSWRVIAKDTQGASTESDSRSFITRSIKFNNSPVTENAEFSKRFGHTSIVFDSKIWVIGGVEENQNGGFNLKRDVWFSADGATWSVANSGAQFEGRTGHSSFVMNGKMWLIGGTIGSGIRANDIWSSSDGVFWENVVDEAPFSKRTGHTTVVYDNKMWVIGGLDENGSTTNDVWSSADGLSWQRVTSEAPFSKRHDHSMVVFEDKLWLVGGQNEAGSSIGDLWFSTDGLNWSEVLSQPFFSPLHGHTAVVFDNTIWLIAGRTDGATQTKNVWFSSTGFKWTESTDIAPFSRRFNHTSVVFDDKIWVIAGFGPGVRENDVWTMD